MWLGRRHTGHVDYAGPARSDWPETPIEPSHQFTCRHRHQVGVRDSTLWCPGPIVGERDSMTLRAARVMADAQIQETLPLSSK